MALSNSEPERELTPEEATAIEFVRAWNQDVISKATHGHWHKRWKQVAKRGKPDSRANQRRAAQAVQRARRRQVAVEGDDGQVRVDAEGVAGDGSVAGVGLSPMPEDSS